MILLLNEISTHTKCFMSCPLYELLMSIQSSGVILLLIDIHLLDKEQ